MSEGKSEFYEISAVSRLTGVSPHVLRVWERRYSVVEPRRSGTKRRQYTRGDIRRLTLLKNLVDNGHAIGSVAHLSTDRLEERLSAEQEMNAPHRVPDESGPGREVRIAQVGAMTREAVREAAGATPALRLMGEFRDTGELSESLQPGSVDLLIVEEHTIFPEAIEELRRAVSDLRARRAILIYRLGRNDAIEPLDERRITTLRAPVDATEIRLACSADIGIASQSATPRRARAEAAGDEGQRPAVEIPERLFSDEQLAVVSGAGSAIECECPQHLAHLLCSLSAFERYSEQCEDRNEEDAALHALLHRTTAECRARMEGALSEVLESEGISV